MDEDGQEMYLGPMLERWRRVADDLVWARPYDAVYRARPPYDTWFGGGRLNLSVNCVDRHLEVRGAGRDLLGG